MELVRKARKEETTKGGLSNTLTNLCMALYLSSHYNTVQKHNNKERSEKKPYINLSQYWISMNKGGR